MADYQKLHKMIEAALRQFADEGGMLLGQELSLERTEALESHREGYLERLEDSAFVMGVESREDYPGHFYMVFGIRDAILMSGTLLGIPASRISEKRKLLILEADDVDAFSEIANLIIGSFNSAFQPSLPLKVHLKQLAPSKFVPQTDEVTDEYPVPVGEYHLYRAGFRIQKEELTLFDILVPSSLADQFDPPAVPEEQAEAADATVRDQAESLRRMFPDGEADADELLPAGAAAASAVLVLDDDAGEREKLKDLLAAGGFASIATPSQADVSAYFDGRSVRAVLLGTTVAEERELSLCARLRSISRDPHMPIIMGASQWTRTGVLKAVKNGANDILLKPYEEKELLAKLARCLDTAS